LRASTDLFRKIVQNVRLHWQIHVHCTGHPAQLALSHIEHSIDASNLLSGNLDIPTAVRNVHPLYQACRIESSHNQSIPSVRRNLFHTGLQLGQSQKVHIAILLLIVPSLTGGKMKGVKRIVIRGCAVDWFLFLFLLAIRRAFKVSTSLEPRGIGSLDKYKQGAITLEDTGSRNRCPISSLQDVRSW
jgi:hypothetical protein